MFLEMIFDSTAQTLLQRNHFGYLRKPPPCRKGRTPCCIQGVRSPNLFCLDG